MSLNRHAILLNMHPDMQCKEIVERLSKSILLNMHPDMQGMENVECFSKSILLNMHPDMRGKEIVERQLFVQECWQPQREGVKSLR